MGGKIKRSIIILAGLLMTALFAEACAAPEKADVDGLPYDIRADVKKSISVAEISAQPYIKGGVRPLPEVKDGEKALVWGKDYTVIYENNESISSDGRKAFASVVGIGDYTGTLSVPFDVTPGSLSGNNVMIMVGDVAFQSENSLCEPVLWVIDHGYLLAAGTDYEKEITYTYKHAVTVGTGQGNASETAERTAGEQVRREDIIPAGTVLVATVTGKGAYAGSARDAEFCVLSGTDISKAETVVKPQTYTGHAVRLAPEDISVTVDGKELAKGGADYEIVGYADRIDRGTAKVLIKGRGMYAGAIEAEFQIVSAG